MQQSISNICQQLNSNIQHQHYMYAPPVSQSPDIVSPLLNTSGTMSPSVPNTTPIRHQNSRSQMNFQFPIANLEQSSTSTSSHLTPPVVPIPLKPSSAAKCLNSSEIQTEELRPVNEVLLRNAKYKVQNKVSTLAVKLAKEAIFGDTVLKKCTISGERELPALPQKELLDLKRYLPSEWSFP